MEGNVIKVINILIYFCSFLQNKITFFSVTQQPNSSPEHPFVEVPRSQIFRHTHSVGLLCSSDQPVAENYEAHNRHKRTLCSQQDSNLRSEQWSGFRNTPQTARPPGRAITDLFIYILQIRKYLFLGPPKTAANKIWFYTPHPPKK